MSLQDEIENLIKTYFEPYRLKKRVLSEIKEASMVVKELGYEVEPKVILEALKLVIEITEMQSKWSASLFMHQIRRTLDSGILKRHIIEHYYVEDIKRRRGLRE